MKINILHLLDGAKSARGLTVIIDVFRAFSFECYAIQNNVKRIIPVASKELAYELKQNNPDYLLAGERGGVKLPGFDYGNSPTEIEYTDLSNRILVHTTSAGTQGLEGAVNADEIITGSFVNAKAVSEYILKTSFEEISLVCMGNGGVTRSDEDDLCAEYIQALLQGETDDISKQIENLKFTDGRRFFDAGKKDVFPERDFYLCTQLNRFPFVLKFKYGPDGLGFIQKTT